MSEIFFASIRLQTLNVKPAAGFRQVIVIFSKMLKIVLDDFLGIELCPAAMCECDEVASVVDGSWLYWSTDVGLN